MTSEYSQEGKPRNPHYRPPQKAVQRVDADPSLTTCYCGPPGADKVGHDYGTGIYCAEAD